MKIAIHQPNYLPWLGYFHKMAGCDTFVFLDDCQYTKGGYINRTRIAGEQWLTIPISKGGLDTPINRVGFADPRWKVKHLKTLEQTCRSDELIGWFIQVMMADFSNIADQNMQILSSLAQKLGLTCKLVRSSDLGIKTKSTQRLIDIVKELGGDTYLSGRGASGYQDISMFRDADIEVVYSNVPDNPLSIVDSIAMFGFRHIKEQLHYESIISTETGRKWWHKG